MDYEKKYKEALELARVAAFNGHQSLMEGIFPELKESEDEMIRKEIIKLVKFYYGSSLALKHTVSKDEMVAWLEKQGDHKLAWSEEDKKEYKYVLKFIDNILNNCDNDKDYDCSKRCYNWLKSIKDKIKKEAV